MHHIVAQMVNEETDRQNDEKRDTTQIDRQMDMPSNVKNIRKIIFT